MKAKIQGFLFGLVFVLAITNMVSWARQGSEGITVHYNDITLVVDGTVMPAKMVEGTLVEPFIYNGTTYLPVRSVGEALGKEVHWDGGTGTVYVGKIPSRPAIEVPLYNKPYKSIEQSSWFDAGGDSRSNYIRIDPSQYWGGYIEGGTEFFNSIVFPLNMAASSFRATLAQLPSNWNSATWEYRIYGDDTLLYTSPIMRHSTEAIPIDIDVSGCMLLRIEASIIANSSSFGMDFSDSKYRGIANAVIVTTDY